MTNTPEGTHPHPTSAMAVANWFLARNWRAPDAPPCDHMKLHKLVYYAQAWFMGNEPGKELFPEDIEAWPHGPVIRDVYLEFKGVGRASSINRLGRQMMLVDGQVVSREPDPPDADVQAFLEQIWYAYGDLTGIQLSNATHLDGEPWTLVYDHHKRDLSSKPIIPNQIIRSVFEQKVEDVRKNRQDRAS